MKDFDTRGGLNRHRRANLEQLEVKGQRTRLHASARGVGGKLMAPRGDSSDCGSPVVGRSNDGEPNGGGGGRTVVL